MAKFVEFNGPMIRPDLVTFIGQGIKSPIGYIFRYTMAGREIEVNCPTQKEADDMQQQLIKLCEAAHEK